MTRRRALRVAAACLVASLPGAGLGASREVAHLPVPSRRVAQGILTPVPIELRLPDELAARRVLAHYKVWGESEWTTIELHRRGDVWSGAVPCLEVSTITGDLVYYVRIHDRDGGVIGFSGSRHRPHRVKIVYSAPPPGRGAPARCPDPADCPAGLPGCPSEAVLHVPCDDDADCEAGLVCGWEGYCTDERPPLDWVSVAGSQSLGIVDARDACSVGSQEREAWACFREDGAQYLGTPGPTGERVQAALGPTRLVVGYERVTSPATSLGARAGFAVRGEGRAAGAQVGYVPWSLEARGSWYPGRDPFVARLARPYVFTALGLAMHDLETTVRIREDPRGAARQRGNALEQRVTAWKRAGDASVAVGAGLFLGWSERAGLELEVSAAEAFPYAATLVDARLGVRAAW